MLEIISGRLDPFSLVYYDVLKDKIFIDERLKEIGLYDYCLFHEIEHSKHRKNFLWHSLFDIKTQKDLIKGGYYKKLFKLKPLALFTDIALFVPVFWCKKEWGKTIFNPNITSIIFYLILLVMLIVGR